MDFRSAVTAIAMSSTHRSTVRPIEDVLDTNLSKGESITSCRQNIASGHPGGTPLVARTWRG
eukprot:8849435-Pyramimonas_sp.AAC.1